MLWAERSHKTRRLSHQCKKGQLDGDVVLMGRTQPISHFATASLGPCARATNACNIEGELHVFSGDFIRSGDKCAQVVQAVAFGDDNSVRIIVRVWTSTRSTANFLDILRISDDHEAWDPSVDSVLLPLAWRMTDDANAIVLSHP